MQNERIAFGSRHLIEPNHIHFLAYQFFDTELYGGILVGQWEIECKDQVPEHSCCEVVVYLPTRSYIPC